MSDLLDRFIYTGIGLFFVKLLLRSGMYGWDFCALVINDTGTRHSLAEVIDDPTVKAHILHTKASANASALERFYSVMHKSPSCACYGPHHVRFAAEQRAIKELLLTDRLFRSAHAETRKSYAKMAETVARHKGKVFILSDSHVAGEQLQNLGGIAAILHYGLPELDELEVDHCA